MSSSTMCDLFQKLINYEIQCLKKYDLKLNCLHILKSNLCKLLESDLNLILSNLVWTLRPYFSTNPTFKIPLKNPTSYLVEAGF